MRKKDTRDFNHSRLNDNNDIGSVEKLTESNRKQLFYLFKMYGPYTYTNI